MSVEDGPPKRYGVLLVDPPFRYDTNHGADRPRTAERHYQTLSHEQLLRLPVAALALPDSVLYLWVPPPQLEAGLALLRAWGFLYKTVGFAWEKVAKKDGEPRIGPGHHTRANVELCLLGVQGHGVARVRRDVSQVIRAPRREHSQKPDQVYWRLRDLYGPEPAYLEMFARNPAPGFDSWGNEPNRRGLQLPLWPDAEEDEP